MYKYDIFISYSRKDTEVADCICRGLDAVGVSYFIDRKDVHAWKHFPSVIANAILESRLFLYVASRNAYESKWTNAEITFAFEKKSREALLPYIIDGSTLPVEQQFVLSGTNWRTLEEHPVETSLIPSICELLGVDNDTKSFDADSADVSVAYESDGILNICLADTGHKLKIGISDFEGRSDNDNLSLVNDLTFADRISSSDKGTPGFDFIKNNYRKFDNINSFVIIMAQPNRHSIINAYTIASKFKNASVHIAITPFVYMLGSIRLSHESYPGMCKCGPFLVKFVDEEGFYKVMSLSRSVNSETINLGSLFKGLIIRYAILTGRIREYAMIEPLGYDLKLMVNGVLRNYFDDCCTIPSLRQTSGLSSDTTCQVTVFDRIITELSVPSGHDHIRFCIDLGRIPRFIF